MKIYIAGKIAGDPDYRAKFDKLQRILEEQGHTVLNPAVLPDGLTPAEYMRICFAMIDYADMIQFMPDWQNSGGARLEWEYCHYIGKPTLLVEVAHG